MHDCEGPEENKMNQSNDVEQCLIGAKNQQLFVK